VNTNGLDNAFSYPMGLSTPAATVACRPGATCTTTARPAATSARSPWPTASTPRRNPKAWFHGKPITLEDHQASRMIADPLHLLDCCQESDGAVAIVVASTDRARDLRREPSRSSPPRRAARRTSS
jgi:hypothetical protein